MALSAVIANLITRLSIDAADFDDGIKQAQKRLTNVGASLTRLGSDLTQTITLPLVAAGGAVVKFGSDFESAFAGVKKTVTGTPEQLQGIRDGLRDMAKELPLSVEGLASIAENAGQLGIQTDNILKFTRVAADLGETTNLSANEAATGLARLSNIMGTSQNDFDRLGSVIVDLGNNFATTEKEILDMGLRLSGAGRQIGLSEAQVLGFATALSSVGIEAEAGGTAFSRVFVEIEKSVATGNKNLQLFAQVSGQSTAQFAKAFKEDASGAIVAFIQGLKRVQDTGGSVSVVLDALKLDNVRVADALKRSALAGDLLTSALQKGSKAWEENTALAEEARKRYETFESQVKVLFNRLKDVAVTFFDAIRPVLVDTVIPLFESFVDVLGRAAKAFALLPQPVQAGALALAAVAAAAGPLLVIAGKLVFSYKNVISLFGESATASGVLSSAWSGLSGAGSSVLGVLAGPVGLIALAGGLELAIIKLTGNTDNAVRVWGALKNVGDSLLGLFDGLWRSAVNLASAFIADEEAARGFREAFGTLAATVELFAKVGGEFLASQLKRWADELNQLAAAIGFLTSFLPGHIENVRKAGVEIVGAGEGYGKASQAIVEAGASATLTSAKLVEAGASARGNAVATGEAAGATDEFGKKLAELLKGLGGTKEKIDSLKESFLSTLNPLRDLNKDIAELAKKGFDTKQIAIVYRDRLVDAARAEEEVARWAKILGIELPSTQLNAAAQAALAYAREMEKIKERQRLVAESNARLNKAFQDGTALAHANLDATLRLGEGQKLFSDRTIQVYQDLQRQRAQMQANITSLGELMGLGYSAADAFKALGLSASDMRERARLLGIQFDENTEAVLRHIESIEENKREAERWRQAWTQAFGDVVSRFSKGVSDMIFEGKRLSDSLQGIFKSLAKALVEILLQKLFNPVLKLFSRFADNLGKSLEGLFSGKGFSFKGLFNFKDVFKGGIFSSAAGAATSSTLAAGAGAAGIASSASGTVFAAGAPELTALLADPLGLGAAAATSTTAASTAGTTAAAGSSGILSSLSAFFTNPWTIGIGAALAAGIVIWRKFFVRNIGDVAKDIQRDFAIALDTGTLKNFARSVDITEDTFKKFTKSISLSPAFFKFALESGVSKDSLIAAFSNFEAFGQRFDFGAEAAAAAAGDYSKLNAAWLKLFQNSDQLQAALGGSFDRLLDHSTAAQTASEAVDDVTEAAGVAADGVDSLGDSVDGLADSFTAATGAVFDLADAIASDPYLARSPSRNSSAYAAAQALRFVNGGFFQDVQMAALRVFDQFGAEALEAAVNSLLSNGFTGSAASALLAAAAPSDETGSGRGRNPVTAASGYSDTSRTPEDSPGPAIDALGDRIVDAIEGSTGDIVINVDGEEIGRIAAAYIQRDVGRVGSGFTQALIKSIILNQGGVS